MSHYVATMRDASGFEGKYEYDWNEEIDETQTFMWEDGNYSCDCNRSLFLYDWDESRKLDCGETIALISLCRDGEKVYSEVGL